MSAGPRPTAPATGRFDEPDVLPLARRLRAEGLDVAVHHREREFARAAEVAA